MDIVNIASNVIEVDLGDYLARRSAEAVRDRPKAARQDRHPGTAFLEQFDPSGWHHLDAFDPVTGANTGRTFEPGAFDGMDSWIRERDGRLNLYFSVNEPRADTPHKKLAKVDVAAIRAIPGDIDPRDGEPLDRERARLLALAEELCGSECPPTLATDTGGGIQLMYALHEKLDPAEWAARAEALGRGVAHAFGGDKVQNIDRILRLPGTLNIPDAKKRAKGRSERRASIIATTGFRFALPELERHIKPVFASETTDKSAEIAAVQQAIAGFDEASHFDELDDDLKQQFAAAATRRPELKALWEGDPAALLKDDTSGSGYRYALAVRLGLEDFGAPDFARLAFVWDWAVQDGDDRDTKLTSRTLARDWANAGAEGLRPSRWFEPPDDGSLFPDVLPEPSRAGQPFDFLAASRIQIGELEKVPDREFVLGTRFQPGTITSGNGPGGVSKSTFAILSALAIVTGRPLTGEAVSRSGPVLIYNNEDPKEEMRRRLAGVARLHGVDFETVADRMYLLSGYDGKRLTFAQRTASRGPVQAGPDVPTLVSFVRESGIVHVVLDPMIALHRGLDENSSGDMEQLGDVLRVFAQQTGVSIDLIHHTVKSKSSHSESEAGSVDGGRGSGAIGAFLRATYTLRSMEKKTGEELNLPPDRVSQMVRLDDGKRNNTRRLARERWFEIVSVLPTGELVDPADFESLDPVRMKRAQASVGVHRPFDARAQRLIAQINGLEGEEAKRASVADFVASRMSSDEVDQKVLVQAFRSIRDVGETTARNAIEKAIPAGPRTHADADRDGDHVRLWREMRQAGRTQKWVICRRSNGQSVRPDARKMGLFS